MRLSVRVRPVPLSGSVTKRQIYKVTVASMLQHDPLVQNANLHSDRSTRDVTGQNNFKLGLNYVLFARR